MVTTIDHTSTKPPPPSSRRPPLPVLVLLPLAMLFLAGVIGWTLRAPSRPAAGSVDVGFSLDMISHHDQAVGMAVTELQAGVDPTSPRRSSSPSEVAEMTQAQRRLGL